MDRRNILDNVEEEKSYLIATKNEEEFLELLEYLKYLNKNIRIENKISPNSEFKSVRGIIIHSKDYVVVAAINSLIGQMVNNEIPVTERYILYKWEDLYKINMDEIENNLNKLEEKLNGRHKT